MGFRVGDVVEVCSNEEGFVGSYYTAKILSPVGDTQFLVEYKTLLTDDLKRWLREIVNGVEIRPCPPLIRVNSNFSLLDEVDAYANDGWWVGTITRREADKYYVYFDQSSRDEHVYPFSRLRVHLEWHNGKWIKNSQRM